MMQIHPECLTLVSNNRSTGRSMRVNVTLPSPLQEDFRKFADGKSVSLGRAARIAIARYLKIQNYVNDGGTIYVHKADGSIVKLGLD